MITMNKQIITLQLVVVVVHGVVREVERDIVVGASFEPTLAHVGSTHFWFRLCSRLSG